MTKKVISFLNKIKPKDVIITIFHNDADGICSCVLMNKFLKQKIGREADFLISQPMPPDKNLLQKIRLSLPTKVIFLDLAIDQNKSLIKKIETDCEILVIDHHQISNNLNSKKTVHYNPLFKNSVYQSASYLTYKICSEICNMEKYLWVSLVGIVGDYNIADSMDLINEAKKKYPRLIKKCDQETVHNSLFGQIADMISAAKACRISCEEIVKIISNIKFPDDVWTNQTLTESYRKIQKEMERLMIDAKSNIDTNKNIIFYEIKSPYNLRSPLATRLSKEYQKKLIIIWSKIKNRVKLSARNQNKNIDVGKVLRNAIKGIKHASAGGHATAAGLDIRKGDWEVVKERLEREVNK